MAYLFRSLRNLALIFIFILAADVAHAQDVGIPNHQGLINIPLGDRPQSNSFDYIEAFNTLINSNISETLISDDELSDPLVAEESQYDDGPIVTALEANAEILTPGKGGGSCSLSINTNKNPISLIIFAILALGLALRKRSLTD